MALGDINYSDIYLMPTGNRIKIKGAMHKLPDDAAVEVTEVGRLVGSYLELNPEADEFSINHGNIRFRVATSVGVSGRISILRRLGSKVFAWDQLQFPKHYLPNLLNPVGGDGVKRGGIILIGGKPDSGKTTTAHSLINEILQRESWFCQTIEDPVETILPSVYESGSSIHQVEVSSKEFFGALKIALRSNCDVVFVGEIRDREGAELALQAAQSGYIVITTLHASDIVMCVQRFLDVLGNEKKHQELFAETFRAALWQSLELRSGMATRTLNAKALFTSDSVRVKIRNNQVGQILGDMQFQESRVKNNLEITS